MQYIDFSKISLENSDKLLELARYGDIKVEIDSTKRGNIEGLIME